MARQPQLIADGVAVKYCRDLRRSLRFGAIDIGRELIGAPTREPALREAEMWALRDLSVTLSKGECLGVIGPNGAGKSTLLKALAGIFKPDAGRIISRGRVGSLLELGTGFHSTLTGRENVFINGTILGMSHREIRRKFDDIVAFAEIAGFIDSPVRNYSTGMALRLAFAVAIHTEPDILLIDEILAVGDVGFRAKCYARMESLLPNCAVVLVSHSMAQIARMCSRVMVLEHGGVVYHGTNVAAGIETYYGLFESAVSTIGIGEGADILRLAITSAASGKAPALPAIRHLDPLELQIDVKVRPPCTSATLSLLFYDRETRGIAQATMPAPFAVTSGVTTLKARIASVPFSPGRYMIAASVLDGTNGETPAHPPQRRGVPRRGRPVRPDPGSTRRPLGRGDGDRRC